ALSTPGRLPQTAARRARGRSAVLLAARVLSCPSSGCHLVGAASAREFTLGYGKPREADSPWHELRPNKRVIHRLLLYRVVVTRARPRGTGESPAAPQRLPARRKLPPAPRAIAPRLGIRARQVESAARLPRRLPPRAQAL